MGNTYCESVQGHWQDRGSTYGEAVEGQALEVLDAVLPAVDPPRTPFPRETCWKPCGTVRHVPQQRHVMQYKSTEPRKARAAAVTSLVARKERPNPQHSL